MPCRACLIEGDFIRRKSMKAGVGFSMNKDAFSAGVEVVANAMRSREIERADLVLAFRRGAHDHDEFYRGLRSIAGNHVPVIGGSAIGVITNHDLFYKEFASGAAVFNSDSLTYRIFCVDGLDADEEKSGEILGDALSKEADGKLILLFYDSLKRPPTGNLPPVLNSSSLLLKGLNKKFAKKTPIIGAGLLGDFEFNPTRQFCGSSVSDQKAIAALLNGDFNVHSCITHGCTPLDGIYYEITRMEGSIIYELDGKPIAQIIDDKYGSQTWREQHPVKLLTVGVDSGDKFEMPDESTCINRLILGALPNGEGISIFEPDLENGTIIRFMIRDADEMIKSARENAEEIMGRIIAKGERPVFGLYIDCAGRTAEYQNIVTEEAAVVQDVFNRYGVQLLGFYSGVEIAPMPEKSRGLDWTGVLLIFSEV
jgi:hypothetical protein